MKHGFKAIPRPDGLFRLTIQTYVHGHRRLQLVHDEELGIYPDKAFANAAGTMELVRYRQERNMQHARIELRKANGRPT